MRVTIEIDSCYVDALRKWASVSRTLNAAKTLCDRLGVEAPAFGEQANWTEKELEAIEPALNHLHKQAQEAIWAIDADAERVIMMRRLSKIQTDWYEHRGERVVKVEGIAEDGNTVTVANGRVDHWKDGSQIR